MHAKLLMWSLRHRRWRHLLTAIIMAVTASVVMLFVTVLIELVTFDRVSTDRKLMRLLILQVMSEDELPVALHPILERIDGVQVVVRYRGIPGRHESGATYLVVGEQEDAAELTTDYFPAEPSVIEAWKKERPMGAIVSEATAKDLRLEVGELAEIPTAYGPLKIKVVGISYGASDGHRIAVHYDYVRDLGGNLGTCDFWVFTKPADFERVASAINERTKNSATPVQAVSADSVRANMARGASTVPSLLGFLGVFLMLTTALTLANGTAIAIRERRTETATLRVLGYRRGTLVRLMLSESMLVGLAGGLLALLVTSLLFRGGVQLTPGQISLLKPVEIGVPGIACGLIMSIVVPLIAAFPAALAAVRQPLVDALRDSA